MHSTARTNRSTAGARAAALFDRLWRCEPAADGGGSADDRRGRRFAGGDARRSANHHRRARLAQAVQVRGLHRHLQPDARVDLRMAVGLAARPPRRGLDDGDRVRAGGGDHRRPGLARNDQPFQRVDAARCDAVLRHGRRDPAADAGERGGRRRAVAAAIHRPSARMGPASRHDADHRRRTDRPADDAPNGGAARGRPRRRSHDDFGRAFGRRHGRRSRCAGDRVEPRARRSARSPLHRPARGPGACAHRDRPAAVASP